MSHTSKIFEQAPVKVQNRNGFDLSHLNCGTSKTGQLVPVLTKLLPPNTKFTLGVNMEVSLPPLVAPFYGRVDAIVEGFVIPCSMLYGGWKQFIMNQQSTEFPSNQSSVEAAGGYALPIFSLSTFYRTLDTSDRSELFMDSLRSNENLFEYFGGKVTSAGSFSASEGLWPISLLPFLAYHKICDVWYRNKSVTKTWFAVNPNSSSSSLNAKNVSFIWHSMYTKDNLSGATSGCQFDSLSEIRFPDGKYFWETRQRNYARDYFTAGTLSPQQGAASRLTFDTSSSEGGFSIAALRSANALQKYLETNGLSGDYSDMMRNRWGCRPIDADLDEPYYLGRVVLPVYQRSVSLTSQTTGLDASNPYSAEGFLGSQASQAKSNGEGSICDSFTVTSWSYVMCLFSLVPHAQYSQGINRELLMTELGDFPAPELQTVGNEAVKSYEVVASVGSLVSEADFAYIPRYSRFKYMDDEVHGELALGRSLESFVLQRRLYPSSTPMLTSSFLEIPQDALDSVLAVATSAMNLSCWYEIFFEFKVSMPLADFCIPTLGDIQDTHTIKTSVGGSRL